MGGILVPNVFVSFIGNCGSVQLGCHIMVEFMLTAVRIFIVMWLSVVMSGRCHRCDCLKCGCP